MEGITSEMKPLFPVGQSVGPKVRTREGYALEARTTAVEKMTRGFRVSVRTLAAAMKIDFKCPRLKPPRCFSLNSAA